MELLQVVPTMWNTKIQVPPLSESCCSQLSGFANTPSKALTCSVASLEGKNILVSCHDWLLAAINCVIAWASQTPEVPIVSYLIIFIYIESYFVLNFRVGGMSTWEKDFCKTTYWGSRSTREKDLCETTYSGSRSTKEKTFARPHIHSLTSRSR